MDTHEGGAGCETLPEDGAVVVSDSCPHNRQSLSTCLREFTLRANGAVMLGSGSYDPCEYGELCDYESEG